MALAWNAGWVNSPRGFKSRILRHRSCSVAARPSTRFGLESVWRPLGWRGLTTSMRRGMGRKVAIPWHVLFSIGAGVLYFYFVLPRWPELMGDTYAYGGDDAADRDGRADRPGRAARGVHPAAHPQAGARDPAAGAVHQGLVDRGPRAGRRADHRYCDQRDLAQPGYRRAVVVRRFTAPPPRSRCSGSSRSICRLSPSCRRHRRNRSSRRSPSSDVLRRKKGDEAEG